MSGSTNERAFATRAVAAGVGADTAHGAVMPPLVLSSNFTFEGLGQPRRHDYTRSGNPTRDLLEETLSDLEGAAGGAVTSSGMSSVLVALQLVPAGGVVVAPRDLYGGTWRLLEALAAKGAFRVRWTSPWEPETLAADLGEGVDLLWLETPSNPLLRLTDLSHAVACAKAQEALVVVDNTFLSPARQRPLAFGADVVVHSTTKSINGHSDVVGGAVLARTEDLAERVRWWANALGVTGAPFDAWLTQRGVRTLEVRTKAQEEHAAAVAACASAHSAVQTVHYPGLASHPQHALACEQQHGFGSMLSLELEDVAAVERFVAALQHFTLAESLGGVESLVAHPATMTHASMSAEARRAAGLSDGLVRLSVGLEDGEELVADVQRALDAAAAGVERPALEVAR